MLERTYQAQLIKKLRRRFPGCVIEKGDANYQQGALDLTMYWGHHWAKLEVKAYEGAPERPNQAYFVKLFNSMSFAAFIHPDNEEEILDAIQHAFEVCGDTRIPQRQ